MRKFTPDQVWIDNRFRMRKRMTGKKLFLDHETGFMRSSTSNGFTVDKKQQFLERFKVCSNLKQIAASLFVNVQTIYDHLAMDSKFREEYVALSEIEDRPKQLNKTLVALAEGQRKAFISDLVGKAGKYV